MDEVSAVEGEVDDLLAVDHRAGGGLLGVQERGLARDLHHFIDAADFELYLDSNHLIHLERQVLGRGLFESLHLNGNGILARLQADERKFAGRGDRRFAAESGRFVLSHDGRPGHGSACWIENRTGDRTTARLAEECGGNK